jgi:hypothetical protein
MIKAGDFVIIKGNSLGIEIARSCYNSKWVNIPGNLIKIIRIMLTARKYQAVFAVEWADGEDAIIKPVDKLGKDCPNYMPCKFLENPFNRPKLQSGDVCSLVGVSVYKTADVSEK